ncbi:hypothetical protein SKA31_15200, partial [Enterococcus faecium]
IGNPSLNHRYRKGFYSLFKTLQQNHGFIDDHESAWRYLMLILYAVPYVFFAIILWLIALFFRVFNDL